MKLGQLVASTEDIGQEPLDDMAMQENKTELADGAAVQDSTESDVFAIDAALGDGETAIQSLSDAQAAIPEGEVSAVALSVTESLCASIHHSLGIPMSLATLESHRGCSSAELIATLEDRKEGIVARIIAGLKAMAKSVAEFIMGLFNNVGLLRKRIDGLMQRARAASDDTHVNDSVSSGFKDADSVTTALNECRAAVGTAEDRSKQLATASKALSTKDYHTVARALDDVMSYSIDSKGGVMAGGGYLRYSGTGTTSEKEEGGDFKISVTTPDVPVTEGVRLPASKCVDLLAQCIRLLDELRGIRGNGNLVTHTFSNLVDKLKQVYNERNAEKNEESKIRGYAFKYVREVRTQLREMVVTIPKIAVTNVKAAMTYVENSLAGQKASGTGDSNGPFSNLQNQIKKGDVDYIRTAIRLTLNNESLDKNAIMRAAGEANRKVPGVFVPFEVKKFAGDISNDKSEWNEKYYHVQVVYLKTNFSEKRLNHCIDVRDYVE